MALRSQSVIACLLLPVAVVQRSDAAGVPEYIAGEAPVPTSLEQAENATQRMGARPDYLVLGEWLPELRERLPKSGIDWIDTIQYHMAPRLYYRHRDDGDGSVSEALTVGGALGFKSGYWKDCLAFGAV